MHRELLAGIAGLTEVSLHRSFPLLQCEVASVFATLGDLIATLVKRKAVRRLELHIIGVTESARANSVNSYCNQAGQPLQLWLSFPIRFLLLKSCFDVAIKPWQEVSISTRRNGVDD